MKNLMLAGFLLCLFGGSASALDTDEIYLEIGGAQGRRDDSTASKCSYGKPCLDIRAGVDKGRIDLWGSYSTLSGFRTEWQTVRKGNVNYESLEYRMENYSVGVNFKLLTDGFAPYVSFGTGIMVVHPYHQVSVPAKAASYGVLHDTLAKPSVRLGAGFRWRASEKLGLFGEASYLSSSAMRLSSIQAGLAVFGP